MRILAILLLCCASTFGANGDVASVAIDARGWTATITITGLNTGGTYNLGYGSFNAPSSTTPYFSVTSMGYDDTGTAITVSRRVYLTQVLRKPYPSDSSKDESYSVPTLTLKMALSDFIFAKDSTNLTFTAPAGWYAQGGTNVSASSAISVTDNSTLNYPRVIANWSWPSWDQITGNSWQVRAVAFHRSAQNGRPIRAAKFTASDTHSHTTSAVYVTAPTIDSTIGDAVPIPEYIATMDATSLTQGDTITVNGVFYPWVGDSGSVLDTNDGTNSLPTPLYTNQKWLNNKTGGYGGAKVGVSTTGNDGTGAASNSESGAFVNPFATIGAAYNAAQTYNNANYSHNDGGGVTIYIDTGSYAFAGATVTDRDTVPATWVIITKRTSATKSGVVLNSVSGGNRLNPKMRFKDLTFNINTGSSLFPSQYLWMDGCILNSSASDIWSSFNLGYWTRNTCTGSGWAMGFAAFASENDPPALTRGNDFTGQGAPVNQVYTVIGNKSTAGNNNNKFSFQTSNGGGSRPVPLGAILAFNDFHGMTNTSGTVFSLFNTDSANATGCAIVQNVFEFCDSDATLVGMTLGADASTTDPLNNAIIWNNTLVGNRINEGYNDNGTTAPTRTLWSDLNNLWSERATKHDTFTGAGGANAVRTNAWAVLYGVGTRGTMNVEETGQTAAGSFMQEWAGLWCDQIATSLQPPSGTARAMNYAKWVNRAAATTATTGDAAGGGNYRLQSSSPAHTVLQTKWVLPYDIEGNARGEMDPPGAYASAVPRKGGAFFGP